MATLEDENEAALAKILVRAKLDGSQIPKRLKELEAELKLKKLQKDLKEEQDKKKTFRLIKILDDCEKVAKFFIEEKQTFTELKQPATSFINAPVLKPGASFEVYFALAAVAKAFLLKVSTRKPVGKPKPG